MSSLHMPQITKLNAFNYNTWSGDMQAWLRANGVWRIVNGTSTKPTLPATPTAEETKAFDDWTLKSDKASGMMYMLVEDDQKIHFNGIEDDPVKIWTALRDIHQQKRPGARFNAYDDLFSIRKQEDETLQTLMNRVDTSIRRIQDLRPTGFDLAKLDDELASMAMIRALPDEYSTFASSLLLMDKLDKSAIQQAFVTEEAQRRHRASDAPTIGSALSTSICTSRAQMHVLRYVQSHTGQV